MSQLNGKVGVLYVLENDAKSHRALSIAQFLPEIYIQYVGLLSEDKIPPWLKEVPTCVTLVDRKLHTGTEALELLSSMHAVRQQQMAAQQAPQTQPPQQRTMEGFYSGGRGEMGSMGSRVPQPPPTQYNLQQPPQQYPQVSPQQYPQVSPQQYPAPMRQGSLQQVPQMPNPRQPSQQNQPGFPSQAASETDGVLKGSLQPAAGTGQYGCSLDMAFGTTDEPQDQQQMSLTGKVNQRDIDSYMRLREQTGQVKQNRVLQ